MSSGLYSRSSLGRFTATRTAIALVRNGTQAD
jgi:hypothetical protein